MRVVRTSTARVAPIFCGQFEPVGLTSVMTT